MPFVQEIKPIAESFLARWGPAHLARVLGGRRSLVLAYHNVVSDGVESRGDPSLHVPRSLFAAHLDEIQESCRIVELSRLLEGAPDDGGPPRVALTFDDGYEGALTEGLDELRARELPATFFVPPHHLGGTTFWWDGVRDDAGRHLRGSDRDRALDALGGEHRRIRAWARRRGLGWREAHPQARTIGEADLATAAAHPGVTLASHGWSHVNLARLDEGALSDELARSLEWIREHPGRTLPVISYPYGLSSERVEMRARKLGYRAGFRVAGGALPDTAGDPLGLPRINVPAGLSPNGLQLRLSGILA